MQEKEINAIIGKNIRLRRMHQGYSQSALAALLGITFQQVQKYENGHNAVCPARLLRLSQIFGCGVNDLFGGPGQPGQMRIPGRRSLHLVQNFERLPSPLLQQRIGDLVHTLAALSHPAQENS